MAKVKNVLRQPLVVNVGKEESIHFLAKKTLTIPDEQLTSTDIQNHIAKGNLVVIRIG